MWIKKQQQQIKTKNYRAARGHKRRNWRSFTIVRAIRLSARSFFFVHHHITHAQHNLAFFFQLLFERKEEKNNKTNNNKLFFFSLICAFLYSERKCSCAASISIKYAMTNEMNLFTYSEDTYSHIQQNTHGHTIFYHIWGKIILMEKFAFIFSEYSLFNCYNFAHLNLSNSSLQIQAKILISVGFSYFTLFYFSLLIYSMNQTMR